MSPRGLDLDFEDQLAKGASPLIHLIEFLGQGLPNPPAEGGVIPNLRLERVTEGLLHFKDCRGLPNLDDFSATESPNDIAGGWAVAEADGIGLYFNRPSDQAPLAFCCERLLGLVYEGYTATDEFTYFQVNFTRARSDPEQKGGYQAGFVKGASGAFYGAVRLIACLGSTCGPGPYNEDSVAFPNGGQDFAFHADTGIKVQLKGGSGGGPILNEIPGGPMAWVYPDFGAMGISAAEMAGAGAKGGFYSFFGISGACDENALCFTCCLNKPQTAKWLAYMRNRSVTIIDIPPQYNNGLITVVGASNAAQGFGQLDLGRQFAGFPHWRGLQSPLGSSAQLIVNGADYPFHKVSLTNGAGGYPDLEINYAALGVSEEQWVWGGDVYRVVGAEAAALPSFDICTADVPVEALGKMWTGLGRENIVFDGIRETGDLRGQGVNIQLPATDLASVVAQLRQTHHRGGTVNVYAAHWDEASGKVIGEPKLVSSGFSQGGFEVKEVVPEDPEQPAYAVITARIASRVAELDKRTGIVTNKTSHNVYYPSDDFFLGLEEWIGKEIPWGQDE